MTFAVHMQQKKLYRVTLVLHQVINFVAVWTEMALFSGECPK